MAVASGLLLLLTGIVLAAYVNSSVGWPTALVGLATLLLTTARRPDTPTDRAGEPEG